MKKTKTVFALAAAIFLLFGVRTATASPITAVNEPQAANQPIKLPDANPVHKVELTSTSIKLTFPDGTVSDYNKKYIPLIINGTPVDSDVLLVNNRTLVPLRVLTEKLGGSIEWNAATKTVTVYKDNSIIKMVIGSNTVLINDEPHTIDVPPNIYNNYTYLPLRFVSEALGANVSYNTGEYDPSTMKFNSYMLVQGVSGNAVVDEYDPSWPVLSEFQAESTIKSLSYDLYQQFVQKNDADHPGVDFSSKYKFILSNIDNTRIIGSVSRYFVIESFSMFLFDKYTGVIYTIGFDSQSNWIRRYAEGDPLNFDLFKKAYFID